MSAFDQKIWDICALIPKGCVVTYSDIAWAMGKPSASRAVAQSLARNPKPIITPCHRVIAKNSLGGYSYGKGVSTKVELLLKEQSHYLDDNLLD